MCRADSEHRRRVVQHELVDCRHRARRPDRLGVRPPLHPCVQRRRRCHDRALHVVPHVRDRIQVGRRRRPLLRKHVACSHVYLDGFRRVWLGFTMHDGSETALGGADGRAGAVGCHWVFVVRPAVVGGFDSASGTNSNMEHRPHLTPPGAVAGEDWAARAQRAAPNPRTTQPRRGPLPPSGGQRSTRNQPAHKSLPGNRETTQKPAEISPVRRKSARFLVAPGFWGQGQRAAALFRGSIFS